MPSLNQITDFLEIAFCNVNHLTHASFIAHCNKSNNVIVDSGINQEQMKIGAIILLLKTVESSFNQDMSTGQFILIVDYLINELSTIKNNVPMLSHQFQSLTDAINALNEWKH